QYDLVGRAQRVYKPWYRPPELVGPWPYDAEHSFGNVALPGDHIPGEEICRGHFISPQQVIELRVARGEDRHLSARPFIAQRAGSIIDDLGRRLRVTVPVFEARAKGIMHVPRKEHHALHSADRPEERLKCAPLQVPCLPVERVIVFETQAAPELDGLEEA